MSAGPIAAGSKLFVSDNRSIFQLAATDLRLEDDYLPALGQVVAYRGTVTAIDADAVRVQAASSIIETTPVFAVDGEGMLHSSPDGLQSMTAAERSVAWPPLVGDLAVILASPDGSLASYSHDLNTLIWETEVGTIRDIQLNEGELYVTDDGGVVVYDAGDGEELWRLESDSTASAAGNAGRVYVQMDDGELVAYVFDDEATPATVPEPIEQREVADPIAVVESFYEAFNNQDRSAFAALLGTDARIDGTPLPKPEGPTTLDWWWRFSSSLDYQVEVSNCAKTQETPLAVLVTCEASAHDPTDDVLGISAAGIAEVWVGDGLVRGFTANRPSRHIAASVYRGDDLHWLNWIGVSSVPEADYTATLDAAETWGLDQFGEGYDSACDVLFLGPLDRWPECAEVRRATADAYVADQAS